VSSHLEKGGPHIMSEWTFSSTAEVVVGVALALVVVALVFV
jgi:hypothetical protein